MSDLNDPTQPADPTDPANRRQHPRSPVSLLVQYRFDTLDDFVAEYSVDLSPGGMFLRSEDPPPELGSVIHLQFSLKDGSKLIEGLGRVVWISPVGPGRIPGLGISFSQFDPESLALISQICRNRDAV